LENIEWTEIIIGVDIKNLAEAVDIAEMACSGGLYIEDYSDIETECPKIAHVDLIDEDLLAKDRSQALIHLYVNGESSPMEYIDFIALHFVAAGILFSIQTKNIFEQDWANNWKKYWGPIKIGERLIICPSWEEYFAKENEVVMSLDPGMAFGTGTHESTKLCLEAAQKIIKSSKSQQENEGLSILDLGCGSGILSIAALLLGAQNAVAVDIDELAVRIAAENAKLNGIHKDQYTVLAGNVITQTELQDRIGYGKYDIVFANIVADVIIALAPVLPKFMKKGGILIASGIIDARKDEVIAGLKAYGVRTTQENADKGWVGLVCQCTENNY
jgi:ribosomal protein L11 methyltransferase